MNRKALLLSIAALVFCSLSFGALGPGGGFESGDGWTGGEDDTFNFHEGSQSRILADGGKETTSLILAGPTNLNARKMFIRVWSPNPGLVNLRIRLEDGEGNEDFFFDQIYQSEDWQLRVVDTSDATVVDLKEIERVQFIGGFVAGSGPFNIDQWTLKNPNP